MSPLTIEFLWWGVGFMAFAWAADFCEYAELYLSKKWANDRALNKLEGACLAYALVCAAMMIVCIIEKWTT